MKTYPEEFWSERYKKHRTGWDIGYPSPPITGFIDSLEDKNLSILIPGCGNAYEASYLMEKGFNNVTLIDISKDLIDKLKKKFHPDYREQIKVIHIDFFEYTGQHDLILEQTFFCALPPEARKAYVEKTYSLLKPGGKLAGVLFNQEFEKDGPPFGGSQEEYFSLFSEKFRILKLEECNNSIPPREENELFLIFQK